MEKLFQTDKGDLNLSLNNYLHCVDSSLVIHTSSKKVNNQENENSTKTLHNPGLTNIN